MEANPTLTEHELAELRVRLEVLDAIEQDIDRLTLTRAIVMNERKLFVTSIYKRLGLDDGKEYSIDTTTGKVSPV